MSATVRVYVPVTKGYHGASYLMETEFDMDFLPQAGDIIHPLKNDEESGLNFEIRSRYWDEKGKANLEVGKYVIDPEDDGNNLPRGWHSWYTDRDGNLIATLKANGWWEYGERSER